MADETAPVPPETGPDTLPEKQLHAEENDSSVDNSSPGAGQATPVPLHFEEIHGDIIQQPDTQLPVPDIQEHFEEDDSMSLTNVAIAVGKHRVRVPIQVFSGSEVFYSIVKQAMSNRGSDTESLLQLDFLKSEQECEDLWAFIKFMNPRRLTGEIMFTAADYNALLRFSTNWRFNTVRAATILNFPRVDIVSTIALAREHCIEKWLVPGLNAYARLGRSITMEDVQRLGPNYILKLVAVRETMKRESSKPCDDELISWTETEYRARWDPENCLRSLFATDIELLDIEAEVLDPMEPEAADNDYYLTEMYILVENCLFQSYRELFEASPVFRDMFSLPILNNQVPDGSNKTQPLRLAGIKKVDFKPFLALINPRPHLPVTFTIPAWVSILKLSTMWEFAAIRRLAIRTMSSTILAPAVRIRLAREYCISGWLLPALAAYTKQPQSLTYQDVVFLGWDYILRILQARESLGAPNGGISAFVLPCHPGQDCGQMHTILATPGIQARSTYDFAPVIQQVFQDEIEKIRSAEQARLGTQPSSDAPPATTSIDCKLRSTVG